MRLTTLTLMLAALAWRGTEPRPMSAETTVIVGVVRTAAGRAVPGAAVSVGLAGDTVRSDSTGRFVVRASRESTQLGIRKDGFLAFQYPLMQLSTDSLFAEIELRTDPPGIESYATWTHLRFLCIIVDAPDRLAVRNNCGSTRDLTPKYTWRFIKHNPWNPYFGPVGDGGGVLLATRASGSSAK